MSYLLITGETLQLCGPVQIKRQSDLTGDLRLKRSHWISKVTGWFSLIDDRLQKRTIIQFYIVTDILKLGAVLGGHQRHITLANLYINITIIWSLSISVRVAEWLVSHWPSEITGSISISGLENVSQ